MNIVHIVGVCVSATILIIGIYTICQTIVEERAKRGGDIRFKTPPSPKKRMEDAMEEDLRNFLRGNRERNAMMLYTDPYHPTKRELFAMMAMQGMTGQWRNPNEEAIAVLAVKQADALINELNKPKNGQTKDA